MWKRLVVNITNWNHLSQNVRHGHHMRGKPPYLARSLQDRLDELNHIDESVHYRVNIGFGELKNKRSKLDERVKLSQQLRSDKELERKSRNKELRVDLNEVRDVWLKTTGPEQIKKIADYFNIYTDLFGEAYFLSRKQLQVKYVTENRTIDVQYGNLLKPKDASVTPNVIFDSQEDFFWTLVLTNPDGDLYKENSECVHWFLGNIPGSKVSQGDVIYEYLQPFPPRYVGCQRLVFILYKQDGKIDYSSIKKEGKCLNLQERSFKTIDFYKQFEDRITPASLVFFQSDWDATLTDFYHNVLDMREPVFEYDFPKQYVSEQKWFPKKKPFNLYMDLYRDPKQLNREFLERKLAKTHPFAGPEPKLPFPNAVPFQGYTPSWLKTEKRKSRLGWGRVNDYE